MKIAATPPLSGPLPQGRPGRRLFPRVLAWLLILAVWAALSAGGVLLWFASDLPRPDSALDAARRPSLTLEDRAGHGFANFGDLVGEPLRLSDLPPSLPAAAVAVEDRRFWTHHGIDFTGIARAMWVNLRAGRVVQGGSTITQQVAKTLFLTNARTFRRKVQELLLTAWLEHSFTKQEILEIWLNRVYLGSGAFGVDAAAHVYFDMSARRLNVWQAAMLAGLPRAPSRFNPRVDPAAAIARTREVLAAMVANGSLAEEAAQRVAGEIALPTRTAASGGWFADWIGEQVPPLLPPGADAVARTTLDRPLQALVEARLRALLDGPGAAAGVGQGAVLVLDIATGAVRAMVGGRDYGGSPFNRAVMARRQPGSAFKPFVWLAALEAGARPDDQVLDGPLRIGNWAPADFERSYRGEVTLTDALAFSLNTAAVRLLLQAGGPAPVAAVARRLGIADKLPANASLALGTGEVGLLELASAYAALFNGGRTVAPVGLVSLRADGRDVPVLRPAAVQAVDPELAAMMVRMMTEVVARGTGRAAAVPGRMIAGKTGTAQDYRDAWFVGCNGASIIAVWLGNDDASPMHGVTGGSLPARLFHDIAVQLR